MMIPTDVVTLKLHAAKSKAAFLSDFFRELISVFTNSVQRLLNYNILRKEAIRLRNPSMNCRKMKRSIIYVRKCSIEVEQNASAKVNQQKYLYAAMQHRYG